MSIFAEATLEALPTSLALEETQEEILDPSASQECALKNEPSQTHRWIVDENSRLFSLSHLHQLAIATHDNGQHQDRGPDNGLEAVIRGGLTDWRTHEVLITAFPATISAQPPQALPRWVFKAIAGIVFLLVGLLSAMLVIFYRSPPAPRVKAAVIATPSSTRTQALVPAKKPIMPLASVEASPVVDGSSSNTRSTQPVVPAARSRITTISVLPRRASRRHLRRRTKKSGRAMVAVPRKKSTPKKDELDALLDAALAR